MPQLKTPLDLTRLFLIRHGEVEEKYQQVFGGRIDMELSPLGHDQSRSMAEYLKSLKFNRVYTSPMVRVRQTAIPILKASGHEPVIIDQLREVDFGAWTGFKWHQIQEEFGLDAEDWLTHLEEGNIADAETAKQYTSRIGNGLRRILSESTGTNVVVICHGGVIRMLLSLLLEFPLASMNRFEVDYSSLTVVEHRTLKTEVKLLNFAPWLHLNGKLNG